MISEIIINAFLVTLMLTIAVFIINTRKVISTILLAGTYSLVAALMFVSLDAVDVAFTEASVGAGISTILFLAALSYLPKEETERIKSLFRKFDAIYASANELQTRLRKSLCARTHPLERARAPDDETL